MEFLHKNKTVLNINNKIGMNMDYDWYKFEFQDLKGETGIAYQLDLPACDKHDRRYLIRIEVYNNRTLNIRTMIELPIDDISMHIVFKEGNMETPLRALLNMLLSMDLETDFEDRDAIFFELFNTLMEINVLDLNTRTNTIYFNLFFKIKYDSMEVIKCDRL